MSAGDRAGTGLALFDLDHTLIPFDSGLAWVTHLAGCGVLPAAAEAHYLACCRRFVDGSLDQHALHRASLPAPLRDASPAERAQWQRGFGSAVAARLPASTVALVRRHLDAGHLCAIVTATTELIARPVVALFGVAHLIATRAAGSGNTLSGEIDGEPCAGPHKVDRVQAWLAAQGGPAGRGIGGFERSWFYSDSIRDLPLLEAVSNPVVVAPDAPLRAHALARGWPIVEAKGSGAVS